MPFQLTEDVSLVAWPEGTDRAWAVCAGQLHAPDDALPVEGWPRARDYVLAAMNQLRGLPSYWPALAIEFVFPIEEERREAIEKRPERFGFMTSVRRLTNQ